MEVKPSYKLTDVGVIPQDWSIAPLGQLILIAQYGSSAKSSSQGRVPVLRMGNLQNGTIDWSDLVYTDDESEIRKYRLYPRDVLFNRTNTVDIVGKTSLYRGERPAVFAGYLIRIQVAPGLLDSRFLNYVLNAEFSRKHSAKVLSLAVGQANINSQKLKTYPIPLPPNKVEQEAIAEALADAEGLIEGLDRLIAKKRDLKQAAMQQFLTSHTRLPGFSGAWETKLLGSIGTFGRGKGIRKDDVRPDGLPCVRYGEIYTHHNNHIRAFYSRIAPDVAAQSQRLTKGDLLFTGSGETAEEIGKCVAFLGDEEAYAGGDIIILSPCGHDSAFLGYLLNSPAVARQKARMGQGDAVVHISARNLARVELLLPSPPEQAAIATVLSDMDAEIAALEARRDKTRLLKQGMMQELLTGKTRLVAPAAAAAETKAESTASAVAAAPAHNWAINEAVVISVLAKTFGSEKFPLGRKRYTKLSYLLHRHVERKADGYLKKAAGPYNPSTKYGGPEKIAQKNNYIRKHNNGTYTAFVAAENIDQAEGYFEKWYGPDALKWLEQFRYKKNDDLEVLATVDMAVQDLRAAGAAVTLDAIKGVIRSHPEWEAKLDRPVFADANIETAIEISATLFG